LDEETSRVLAPLAGNLIAEGGVCSLDLACFHQHLLDLPARNHYG